MKEAPKEKQVPTFSDLLQNKSSEELLRYELMQRRYDLIEAIEYYEKYLLEGYETSREKPLVITRTATLFRELRPILIRKHLNFPELEKEFELIKKGKGDFLGFADKLIFFMDQIGLTRIDIFENTARKRLED